MIREDMFELYAFYDAIFTEIPYFDQLHPFDLVALDTNLQEHLESKINGIKTCMEWITQVGDSFTKWLDYAPTSKPIPCVILTLEQRIAIYNDLIKATDFLGKIYRAYKDLINTDPNNRLKHMTS